MCVSVFTRRYVPLLAHDSHCYNVARVGYVILQHLVRRRPLEMQR